MDDKDRLETLFQHLLVSVNVKENALSVVVMVMVIVRCSLPPCLNYVSRWKT